ncbi:DUF1801 domain-containing protein [Pontibacter sp. JH31]|uniref:DUF1801 domain-containing protein n=1 Tax=Pontibacter aquaedesilientis TaxID=2766980 RepID=A0ABR7XII0_9BACT|nr:DUF1801 domain-containing protein [Pontibacter aquaedesilientis]MBD1398064.1 DUF1801 domain-containing protein [Pontibacter aquaedesilientis]
MQSTASTPELYLAELPEERQHIMTALRDVIRENLPAGFEEVMSYGMLGYAVPHTLYPAGYHCDPKQPLPFMSIASQKRHIAVYHMGMYADEKLLDWFKEEYSKHSNTKLDMGKSCIRFKKPEQVPLALIGELASKMTPQEWVQVYESQIKR